MFLVIMFDASNSTFNITTLAQEDFLRINIYSGKDYFSSLPDYFINTLNLILDMFM